MLLAQDQVPVGRASFLSGLTSAQWPARFQRLADGQLSQGVETWLDGAHNLEAARALAALLADHGPKHIVLGILANKDASAIIAELAPQRLRPLRSCRLPITNTTTPPISLHCSHGRTAGSIEEALRDLPAASTDCRISLPGRRSAPVERADARLSRIALSRTGGIRPAPALRQAAAPSTPRASIRG